MKHAFTISAALLVTVLIGFACKKSSSSSSSSTATSTSTTSGTTTGTSANTVTYTTSSSTLTGTVTPACYISSIYGTNNTNTQIGGISLNFPSGYTAGTFTVVPSNPGASQVVVGIGSNYAAAGTVLVSVLGGKNKATFNNVTGTSPTSFTLTGTLQCP